MDQKNISIIVFGLMLVLSYLAYDYFVSEDTTQDEQQVESVTENADQSPGDLEEEEIEADKESEETEDNEEAGIDLEEFNEDDLAEFDGSDPDKPIYISIEGDVYDVSAKPEFYGEGGAYNFLVGKEAAQIFEDEGIGSSIITNTYPKIGVLKDN